MKEVSNVVIDLNGMTVMAWIGIIWTGAILFDSLHDYVARIFSRNGKK